MWMLGGAKPSTTTVSAESSKPKLQRHKSSASRSSKKSSNSRKSMSSKPSCAKRSKSVSSRKSKRSTLSKKSAHAKKSNGGSGKQVTRTAKTRSSDVSPERKSRGRSRGAPKKRSNSRRSVKSRSRLESRDDDAVSIPLVDRIPTAVGYSSESSEDEWLEEQSKCSRYSSFRDGEFSDEDDFDDDKYSSASNLNGIDRLWSVSTDSSPEIGLEDDSVFAKFDYDEEIGPDPIYQSPKGGAPRDKAKKKTKSASRSTSPKSKIASKSRGERSKSKSKSKKGSKIKAKLGSQASKATTVPIKNTKKRGSRKKTLSPTPETDDLSTKMDGIDELRDSPPDSKFKHHDDNKKKHPIIEKRSVNNETRPNKKSAKGFMSTTSTLSDSEFISMEADEMVAELERKIKELKAAAQEAKEELTSKLERKKIREAKLEEINRRARQKRMNDAATHATTTSSKSLKSKASRAGSNKSRSNSVKSGKKSIASAQRSSKSVNTRSSSKSRSKRLASAAPEARRSKSIEPGKFSKTRRASSPGSSVSSSKRSRGRSNTTRKSGESRSFSDTRKKMPKDNITRTSSTSRKSKSTNRSKTRRTVSNKSQKKELPDLDAVASTQPKQEDADRKFLDAIERTRSDASVLGTNIIIDDNKSTQTPDSKASGRSRFFQLLRSRSYDRHGPKDRSKKSESIMYTRSLLSAEEDDHGLLELVSDEGSNQDRKKSKKLKKKGFLPRVLSSISRSKWTGADLKTSESDLSVLKPRIDRKRKSKVVGQATEDAVEKVVSSPKSVEALDEYPEILVPQHNFEPPIVQCLRFYSCGAMAEGMNVALLAGGCHNPPPQLEYDFFEEEEDDIVYDGKSPRHAVEVVLEKADPNRSSIPVQKRRTQQVPMKKLNSMNCQTRNYSEQIYEEDSLCLPSRPYVLDVTDKHLQLDSSAHHYIEKRKTPARRRSASGAFSVTSIGVPTRSTATIDEDDYEHFRNDEINEDHQDDTDDDNDENSAVYGKAADSLTRNRKFQAEFENALGPKNKNKSPIRKLIHRFRKKQPEEGPLVYI